MKTKCLIPIRYIVAASLMLIGVVLTCYDAGANLRRGSVEQNRSSEPEIFRSELDEDPEYREQRREFLDRFLGNRPGSVSAAAYKRALAEARALPPSPLLGGQTFRSAETPGAMAPWTSPIAPPIMNSYSANASAAVYSLAIDPINANTVYTGNPAGLAKTTDGGGTWRYLSDRWESQSVSAIAINPAASNEVYVGTGREGAGYASYQVGLYRSFDGGLSWSSPLGETDFDGTYIRAIAVDPNASYSQSATTLYVANGCDNDCGLWRSTDSGVSWSQKYQARHGVYDVAMDIATHPSTLYITEDNGTYKSTDSGQSWTSIHDVLEGSRNRLSVVNSAIYLLGPDDLDHNLYKSMDGGATWIQIPTNCFAGATAAAATTASASECSPWIPPIHRTSWQATWRFTAPTMKASLGLR